MAQYTANQISLPFFTMLIIHLQAKHPVTKAAMKPMSSTHVGVEAVATASATGENRSLASKRASPRMGGMTIRKENWASFSFLLPSSKPVAMVEPERDSPGSTATACAIPMTKACKGLMFSFWRGLAK